MRVQLAVDSHQRPNRGLDLHIPSLVKDVDSFILGVLTLLAVRIRFLVLGDSLLLLLLLLPFLLDILIALLTLATGVEYLSIWHVDKSSCHVQCRSSVLLHHHKHCLSDPQSLQYSRVPRVVLTVLLDGVPCIESTRC